MSEELRARDHGHGLPYRLVAVDLDGTLKPRGADLTPRVRDAVAAAQAADVVVCIATGRLFRSALPFAQQLGIQGPMISLGGALVKEVATGTTLFHQGIPFHLVRRVVEAAHARRLGVAAYVGDDLYVEAPLPNSPLAAYLGRPGTRAVDDLVAGLPEMPNHMAMVSEEARTRGLVLDLRSEFGASLNVTSGHPLLAEIDHPAVSKGAALALVAGLLGVDRAGVIAVGDDWNDISMLEYAELGIAMADAQPEVLAACDVVAPAAAEDGVAWVIERYILETQPRAPLRCWQ